NFYQLKPAEKVIYLGIDCTGENLHIGHLFLYFQTVRFAKEGFTVLLVLGGGTSKIGDPSDKDKERPLLEEKQIENYQEKIKLQLERILIKPKKIGEFSYPLIQAYDFYYLYENYNCRGQLGGSDQWGNLTTGLELIKKVHSKKEAKTFAFNFPLLTDKDGKKFSKSESGKKIL
ncbi:15340_t:CDS:2, partial [Funneliformis geosporum]